jgi:predicted MFS family arabinose efflux permease
VARYEQLRQQVLAGDAGGWRLGLGVLQHRGVAAWLRAWDSLPAPARAARPPGPAQPVPGSEQLVAALATMALACLAACR